MITNSAQPIDTNARFPLITPDHQGRALPDQIRFSIFADYPRADGLGSAHMIEAAKYFLSRNAVAFNDTTGWGYTVREGAATYRHHLVESISLNVTMNPQRLAVGRHGLIGIGGRHGNAASLLLREGYEHRSLRTGMCADIADAAAKAKQRYAAVCLKAFGVAVEGQVHANFSSIEMAYDFAVDPGVIPLYARSFRKLFERSDSEERLSGGLRKGERFAIYLKEPRQDYNPLVRFEASITGARIKNLTGSQRVPEDADAVARVLDKVEARCLPLWLEVERHRQGGGEGTFGQLACRLPRTPNLRLLDDVARELSLTGRIKGTPENRSLIVSLTKRGFLQNPKPVTGVRGVRATTPETDDFWRAWTKRP